MAEISLVALARVALEIAQTVLPDYRSKFSKRIFTQPQLLAILCLMRYEDWTFREAEVRWAEHRELQDVLGLRRVPEFGPGGHRSSPGRGSWLGDPHEGEESWLWMRRG